MMNYTDTCAKIIEFRNAEMVKSGIDYLDNDNMSLGVFAPIIKKIDPNYEPNFARNGDDGFTIQDDKEIGVESKTSKVKKYKRKKGYPKATFAFHAKGLISYDRYAFCTWDKNTLQPLSIYYVKDSKNVTAINDELKILSDEWSRKPTTKAGYDVIRIKEIMLTDMIKTTKDIDGCKVYIL